MSDSADTPEEGSGGKSVWVTRFPESNFLLCFHTTVCMLSRVLNQISLIVTLHCGSSSLSRDLIRVDYFDEILNRTFS